MASSKAAKRAAAAAVKREIRFYLAAALCLAAWLFWEVTACFWTG